MEKENKKTFLAIKLRPDWKEDIETIATLQDVSLSDVVRSAILSKIHALVSKDPSLKSKLNMFKES